MRIKNKKLAAVGVLFTCLLVAVLVCQLLYVSNVNWIIGKNSAQIQEKYGKFENLMMSPSPDGLYRDTCCSYYVWEGRNGWFLNYPPMMFSIRFDENGIAYECRLQEALWLT